MNNFLKSYQAQILKQLLGMKVSSSVKCWNMKNSNIKVKSKNTYPGIFQRKNLSIKFTSVKGKQIFFNINDTFHNLIFRHLKYPTQKTYRTMRFNPLNLKDLYLYYLILILKFHNFTRILNQHFVFIMYVRKSFYFKKK